MMSSIMSKTLNYAADRVQGREVSQTIDVRQFIKIIMEPKNQRNSVESVCKILKLIKYNFNRNSDLQKRKYMCALIYCCQVYRDTKTSKVMSEFFTTIVENLKGTTSIASKRLFYTALVSIIECNNSELIYLSVNTILNDISSKDTSVIQLALMVACQIATIDIIPVLLPIVEQRITHTDTNVRIKAFQVLHCMHRVAPGLLHNTTVHITKGLTDKHPAVMTAAVPYIYDIVKKNPSRYHDISSKLIFILHQVSIGNLPHSMNRHGIPAPWLTIQILKILMLLDLEDGDKKKLEKVLLEIMNRCQMSKKTISFALLSECIQATVVLYNEEDFLFKLSADILPLFLQNIQANVMLAGLDLLTQLSKISVKYCSKYQDLIMNCLDHNDKTIKRQTLVLLESLVNSNNYKIVIDQMIKNLVQNEKYFVNNFSKKIAIVSEKFYQNVDWFVNTLHSIMIQSGDNCSEIVPQKLFAVLNKATNEIKALEVERCLNLMKGSLMPDQFQFLLTIVSEYCLPDAEFDSIVDNILAQYSKQKAASDELSLILIFSISRLCLMLKPNNNVMDKILKVIDPYSSVTIYQSVAELQALIEDKEISNVLMELDYSNFQYDDNFSFLDTFANDSEQAGDFEQEFLSDEQFVQVEKPSFKFQPYEENFNKRGIVKNKEQFLASVMHDDDAKKLEPGKMAESFLSKKVETKAEKVWGKEGYLKGKSLGKNPVTIPTTIVTEPNEENSDKIKLSQVLFGDISSSSSGAKHEYTGNHRPRLDQALLNLSAVAKTSQEDHDILDAMNNMIMTSQSGSSNVTTDHEFE